MTDKERLEGIKEEYKWHVENQLLPRTSDDNFEWLIEQAERVQMLEKLIEREVERILREE